MKIMISLFLVAFFSCHFVKSQIIVKKISEEQILEASKRNDKVFQKILEARMNALDSINQIDSINQFNLILFIESYDGNRVVGNFITLSYQYCYWLSYGEVEGDRIKLYNLKKIPLKRNKRELKELFRKSILAGNKIFFSLIDGRKVFFKVK